jgi:hypothetical protein
MASECPVNAGDAREELGDLGRAVLGGVREICELGVEVSERASELVRVSGIPA